MKKRTILAKKIVRDLERYKDERGSHFSLGKLLEDQCLYFDIDDYYFGANQDFTASGELRQKTIETLLNVYRDWEKELNRQEFDYYLAVWICLPRLGRSQVVCGIGELIDYYKNDVFLPGDQNKRFHVSNFGKMSGQLRKLTWELKIDLDNVSDCEVNFPKQNYEREKDYVSDQRKYRTNIRKAIRVIEKPTGNMYLFPVGDVWVGKTVRNLT